MSDTPTKTKGRAKKDDYIVQGSILAAAAVLTKKWILRICISGLCYRIDDLFVQSSDSRFKTGFCQTCKKTETECISGISLFPCICSGSRFIYFADDFPGGGTDLYPCDEIPVKCLCTPCTCTGLADRCGNGGHPWIFSGNGDDDSDGYFTDH